MMASSPPSNNVSSLASSLHVQNHNPVAASTSTSAAVVAPPPPAPTINPSRQLRTPHSGYHFDGSKRRFFEGWYFKLTLPEEKTSFAFIYSIEDPSFSGSYNETDKIEYGPRFPGAGAQVMEGKDNFLFQYSQDTSSFWASRHELALGNTFVTRLGQTHPRGETSNEDFLARVDQGYQVTPVWHQGSLCDDGRDTFFGDLKLEIRERTKNNSRVKVILSVTSDLAALEVGGGPWDSTWKCKSESSRFIKPILGLPIDVGSLFSRFTSYMPAGL